MNDSDDQKQENVHTSRAHRAPGDIERHTIPPDRRPLGEQPRCRQDFPIDWPQDEYVSRRDLVKFMVLTSLAFTAGQMWILGKSLIAAQDTLPELPVAQVDDVAVGGHVVFRYPEDSGPRLLVRTSETGFVAYDQQCTHLLCPVVPQVEEGMLHCPCHNAYFALESGRVVAGPPRRPLPRVTLEVRDGIVYATGMEDQST